MTACRPWCTGHIGEHDMCTGDDVDIIFGFRGDNPAACSEVVVDLSQTSTGTPSMVLHVNDFPIADLGPRQAAAIGAALLAQSARALGDEALADYYRSMAVVNADTAAKALR